MKLCALVHSVDHLINRKMILKYRRTRCRVRLRLMKHDVFRTRGDWWRAFDSGRGNWERWPIR